MRKIILGAVALLVMATAYWHQDIVRLYKVTSLFSEEKIVQNFTHMNTIFNTKPIKASSTTPFSFSENPEPLPTQFTYQGMNFDMQQYLENSRTTALMVVKGNAITFERYFLGTAQNDLRISWSVSKGFIGALAGIALSNSEDYSLDTKIVELVPTLQGSGYEHATLKHLLQMSSGIAFNEDYSDSGSDVNRLKKILAFGGSFDDFATTLTAERPPGTHLKYVSMDTHVLGMAVRAITQQPIETFLEEALWQPMGCEYDANIIVDSEQQPMVLGGLNATTRDFAKLGMLYRDDGMFNGKQLVPAHWVSKSITPDAPYLMPGKRDNASTLFGYGFQWWLPVDADREFFALGVYGQFIYVDKKSNIVIVKNSANTAFADDNYQSIHKAIAAFRAIATSM